MAYDSDDLRSRIKALETALKLAIDGLEAMRRPVNQMSLEIAPHRRGGWEAAEVKIVDLLVAARAVLEGRFEKQPAVKHWEDIANFGREKPVTASHAALFATLENCERVEELRLHARGVLRAGAEFLEKMTRSNIEHASGCVTAAQGMLAKADEILEKGIT